MEYTFTPIGHIRSCFKEKFSIPKQPGLAPSATADLEIDSRFAIEEAFRELTGFSHIWLVFVFHETPSESWRPTVRPPRLGGNQRVGVFASRSGFRPNPIGISAVQLTGITRRPDQTCLHLRGVDLLDGTPVLDIKPYLPYADSLPFASSGYAAIALPEPMTVTFSPEARARCEALENDYPELKNLVTQVLGDDPRPAYYRVRPKKEAFGVVLYDLEIKWEVRSDGIRVTTISRID